MIDGHVMKQETSEPSKVCGAETAEEKAAQEFKQRTEAGAGASDTKSVAEQVRFVTLDEKTNLPLLLLLKQYIPDRAVVPTQWPGSVQKYPTMLSDGIHWFTNLVKLQLLLPYLAYPSWLAISGEACAG